MSGIFDSFSIDRAKELLNSGIGEAQELIRDPSKIDALLEQFENKLKEVPVIGESLSGVPLMISMIKSYITKEYQEVSPKVIALMVSALVYLVKKKDIVPDSVPVLGYADDIAVIALALKLSDAELKAFAQWREGRTSL